MRRLGRTVSVPLALQAMAQAGVVRRPRPYLRARRLPQTERGGLSYVRARPTVSCKRSSSLRCPARAENTEKLVRRSSEAVHTESM